MPLVRLDVPESKTPAERRRIGEAVQQALHEALGVPVDERFQVIAGHAPEGLSIDPGYLGVTRSPDALLIQVTLNRGRDAATKQSFFRAAVALLESRAGVRPSDVVISLVEVGREDWSFGDGAAQLA